MACMHRYMWGQASVDSGGLVDMDSYGRWSGVRGLLAGILEGEGIDEREPVTPPVTRVG